MKYVFIIAFLFFIYTPTSAQVSGSLMQHPDISNTQITFIYGDDVWITAKNGGSASRLSSPDGLERHPRFSPDGSKIAYTANYNGNSDVYVINSNGGIPLRLTYHGMFDRVLGWTPDGKSVLFASSRESGRQRYSQFYTIPATGGAPTKLPIPYGEYASFSPDGLKVAYTDRSRVNRNWKRYRGGTAPDISVFDLSTYTTENITNNTANDELPMWHDDGIYYMSDNGPNKRNNLWKYDLSAKTNTQLTSFKDFDITFPEKGANDIIFEAGGKLYIYNLASNKTEEVSISIVSDRKELISQQKNVASYMQSATISPDGKRVVVQARGELFNLPAEEGYVANISATSGSAERKPSWSPDGNFVACWSDVNGEYQLLLYDMSGEKQPKIVTNFTSGFNYEIFWSPDSKKIVYVDQAMRINYLNVNTGEVTNVDRGKSMLEGGLRSFTVTWSPDSNWIAYSRATDNPATAAIFLYDSKNNKVSQLTSGYYKDYAPAFSVDGNHLFFATNRTFNPVYSDLDNTFVYPNATNIAVGTLNKSEKSLLEIKNDAYAVSKKGDATDKKEDKNKKKKGADKNSDDTKKVKKTIVEIDGFEMRVEMLDITPGNLGNLVALNPLRTNRFCYNMHSPLTPAQIFSGPVLNGLRMESLEYNI